MQKPQLAIAVHHGDRVALAKKRRKAVTIMTILWRLAVVARMHTVPVDVIAWEQQVKVLFVSQHRLEIRCRLLEPRNAHSAV
jgi:hypothetical protein